MWPFTKNKERIIKKTKQEIYLNKLDKACFQHDMPYGDVTDLPTRTATNRVLRDKKFVIAKYPKYDGY